MTATATNAIDLYLPAAASSLIFARLTTSKQIRRACLPSPNMDETSPLVTFHPFSRLPRELRDHIWFFCLPRRVVPLDDIFWNILDEPKYKSGQQCWANEIYPRRGLSREKTPPFIASVCREAREVAFRWGGVERTESGVSTQYVWIQRNLDTLLFAWTYADSVDAGHDEDMLRWFLREQRTCYPGAQVGLTCEHVVEFDPNPSALENSHTPCVRADSPDPIAYLLRNGWKEDGDLVEADLSEPMDVDVVLQTVYIHATKADLLASQLFGRIADEPSQLVDYDDVATLAKFRALFDKNPDNQKRVALTDAFDAIQSPEFPAHVEQWLVKVAWKLLALKWVYDKQHNPQSSIYKDPKQVFDRFVFDNSHLWMKIGREIRNSFKVNHPWVIEETQRLPKLRPKIWFTYCTKACQVKVKP